SIKKERYAYMKEWMGKLRTLLVLGSIVLVLSACGRDNLTALVPKGYGADISMKLIILTTVVMTFVFIVVMILMVIVLLRYRKKKGDKVINPEQVEGNKMLETLWTIIPIILVVIMAVPTIFATFHLAESKDAAYHLNSNDVIHSFWVPSITGKLDVNPENENTMYIEAYEEGVYYGKCAELCGPSHSLMDFKLIVVSEEEYDQWVADMQDFDSEELD